MNNLGFKRMALVGAVILMTAGASVGSQSLIGINSSNLCRVLSLWQVNGATPGASVKLWAQVQNNGLASLPSNTQAWFWVSGPNWTGTHWVGSVSINDLAPGSAQWYALDWSIPSGAEAGSYAYWAQIFVGSLEISDWSAERDFSVSAGGTPGKAVSISPLGSISTTTPAYAWNAVSNSTWYYLWVDDNSGATKIATWYTADKAGCATGSGTCTVTPATALAAGEYRWWIQTWNVNGYGPWNDGMSFQVAGATVPLVSIAVTPANPSIRVGSTIQFRATGTYTDGRTQNLTGTAAWTSSVPGVATIDAAGLATGIEIGSTTITAGA